MPPFLSPPCTDTCQYGKRRRSGRTARLTCFANELAHTVSPSKADELEKMLKSKNGPSRGKPLSDSCRSHFKYSFWWLLSYPPSLHSTSWYFFFLPRRQWARNYSWIRRGGTAAVYCVPSETPWIFVLSIFQFVLNLSDTHISPFIFIYLFYHFYFILLISLLFSAPAGVLATWRK